MVLRNIFVPLLLLALLYGCASAPKATEARSGFLSDYSQLKADSDGNSASYYAEGYDPKNYGQITFAPVKVQLSQKLLAESKLDATQQQRIADYLAGQLNQRLAGGLQGKGSGTLTVRAAISGVTSSSEELSAWQYLPIALVATAAKEAAGSRDQAPMLFLESEAVDAASGKVVSARVRAMPLGLVKAEDGEKDPVAALKPIIAEWLDQLMANLEKKVK
ncbi:hypothetical protein C2E25_06935 [Geothermobacter hydrogeniphilus]|uniref:DUF3313 domain-containing protein n=1 Tax=Geothermobacter hydrogeniphilus TaxID=1969733 RepID=A0A2K2HAV3_9BACT|nr:DUF3313 domain-containing protein [Geothermobacter hydrogeniphilus]PNU20448.1 hypothetical protein C2E25_06935 [Geothermobacter hydrogeniphilus]